MKIWRIIKTVLYSVAGLLILVFNEPIMPAVGTLVGSVVIFYGIDITILSILKGRFFGENSLFFGGLVQLLMGVIIIIVRGDIVKVCLVWAVWSILREGKELSESLHAILAKRRGFINFAESVTIIVFSFMMIMEPTEHHAHFHVIILGIELILEVFFPIANDFIDRLSGRKIDAN